MPKNNYRFNEETLSYDKVNLTLKQKIYKLVIKLFQSFSLALVILLTISIFIDSPKERLLKREREELLTQYQILNQQLKELDNIISKLEERDNNIYRVIFETEPITKTIRRAGTGGVNKYESVKNMNNAKLVINTSKKLDQLLKASYIQSKSYDEVEKLVTNKKDMHASIPAILPVALSNTKVRISSGYGYRIHPIYKTRKFHSGLDFSGPIGTPIYTTGDGTIEYAKNQSGYGKTILINHNFNHKTLYAHLDNYTVRKGQKVKRGDLIGYMGNTGVSTGPHLHYEVIKNNKITNPGNYFFNDLSAEEYDILITNANMAQQTMD